MNRRSLFLFSTVALGACSFAFFRDGDATISVGSLLFTPATAAVLFFSLALLGWISLERNRAISLIADIGQGSAFHSTLLTIVLIGFVLRVAGLHEFALNGDEHIFVNTSSADTLTQVWAGLKENHHPPGNFFALHYLLGVSYQGIWLRTLSLACGVYLIWISAMFAKEWFGPLSALAMAVLVAFSPALVELSRVCRNYAPGLAAMMTAIFFFARFLRREQWRDFLLFALFEFISVTWLYSVILNFITMNLVLVFVFVRRRPPLSDWAKAIGFQLPVAFMLLFLYVEHISIVIGGGMSEWTASIFHEEQIFNSPLNILLFAHVPLGLVFRYLLADFAGTVLFGVALLGTVQLWVARRRGIFFLCVLPVLLAYAFKVAGLLPLSGGRQSTYLFPFLFTLIVAFLPESLGAHARKRKALAQIRNRINRTENETAADAPTEDSSTANAFEPQPFAPKSFVGLITAVSIALLYVNFSLGMIEGTILFDRQDELPTKYSQLEDTIRLLEERIGPNDLALVSYQGLMAYHAYFKSEPLPYEPEKPAIADRGDLKLRYSIEAGWFFTPDSLVRAALDELDRNAGAKVEKIWVVRGAGWPWEKPIRDWFHNEFPNVRLDDAVFVESGGWLLAAEAEDFEPLRERVQNIENFDEIDFIRSQFDRAGPPVQQPANP